MHMRDRLLRKRRQEALQAELAAGQGGSAAGRPESEAEKPSAKAPVQTGQCTYCGRCAPCLVGIDIAFVNKCADEAAKHDQVPQSILDQYLALDFKASDCSGCYTCESRCPFGVPITSKMYATAELFGC